MQIDCLFFALDGFLFPKLIVKMSIGVLIDVNEIDKSVKKS